MPKKYKKLFNQDYKKIFMYCARTASHFRDDMFPPCDTSLWKHKSIPEYHEPLEWKRCKDITSDPHLFIFKNKQLNTDVVKGVIGDCWFVAALGVLAAHPKLLNKVVPKWTAQDWCHSTEPGKQLGVYNFRDTERHPGIFRFRFYRFGEWIEVVVDDYLPTKNRRLIYAHSKNPKEMWCSLLEKAYAKLCKCYEALEGGSSSDALVDLTGAVPETIQLHSEEGEDNILQKMGEKNFVAMIQVAIREKALVSCSIDVLEDEIQQERLPNGLVVGHAYGITNIQVLKVGAMFNKNEIILIRLHNPWGEVEWNGLWSDKSPEWQNISKSKRKQLGFTIADDGDFWMSFQDFISNFSTLTICRCINTSLLTFDRRWHGAMFRGEWLIENETAGGCINNAETFYQNPQYSIKIHKSTILIVSLMQQDNHAEIGAEKITIGFIILKVELNRKYRIHKPTYEIAGRVTYINSREVTQRFSLKPGHYILIPSAYNVDDEGSYFMRLFSSNPINARLLRKDSPKRKWYYPLIYYGKPYFVGTIRAQILGGQFSRRIDKVYIKITFTDFKKTVVSQITPKFDTVKPEIGAEYLFYARDPSNARLLFQLYQHQTFGKDILIGETRILVNDYSKEGKDGKFWEITKTLTRVIQVPKHMGMIRTEEVEASDNPAHVYSRNERLASGSHTSLSMPGGYGRGIEYGVGGIGVMDSSTYDMPNKKVFVEQMRRRKKIKKVGQTTFVPQIVDAGIGDLQIRLLYSCGINS
ncbi:14173_t:CDS:2 [Cetraspora pellucida]|uniref:14173_t:CDS:1 n=1 Tax=Cetraspora pellucida TaxID=1433469 RepID=A0A9N9C1M7_9GLOM|nr:14173_t:CDS:2 [Cetraspora pellucida]